MTGDPFFLRRIQYDELLVRRRIQVHLIPVRPEQVTHLHGAAHTVLPQPEIQPVREEDIELQGGQPALRKERAVLLDARKEAFRSVPTREDNRLAAEGADLRPTDVEHVAQRSKAGQVDFAGRAGQSVTEPRSVHVQRQAVRIADRADGPEFVQGVQGPVFRREGKVDHAGSGHVRMAGVGVEGRQGGPQIRRGEFPVALRQGDDLVPGIFHGTRLMDGDMAGRGRDDPLIRAQQRGDDRRVGLRAAAQEKDICFRAARRRTDLLPRRGGEPVRTVARGLFQVGFRQAAENIGVAPLAVIVDKGNHGTSFIGKDTFSDEKCYIWQTNDKNTTKMKNRFFLCLLTAAALLCGPGLYAQNDIVKEAGQALEEGRQAVDDAKKAHDKAKDRYNNDIRGLERSLDRAERDLKRAQADQKKISESLKASKETLKAKKEALKLEKSAGADAATLRQAKNEISRLTKQVKNEQGELKKVKKEITKAKKDRDKAKKEIRTLKKDVKSAKKDVKNAEKNLKKTQKEQVENLKTL